MYEEVLKRVISVLKRVISDDSINITADSVIMEDLEFSSLEMFYVLSEMESEFGFEISDNMLRKMVTVEDIAKIIYSLCEERKK